MAKPDERIVECKTHGRVQAAFVCRHLVEQLRNPRAERIGFVAPEAGLADERQAWCGDCDAVLRRVGEWNDESEAFAGVTLICSGCYGNLRRSQS